MSNPSPSRAGTAQPEGTPFPSPTQAASTADIPTVDEAVPLPAVGAIPPPDEQAAELLSDAPAAAVPQEEGEEELDVEADVDELAPDTPASSSLSEEEISPSRRFDPRNASEEAYYVKKGWGLPVPESEPLDRSFFGSHYPDRGQRGYNRSLTWARQQAGSRPIRVLEGDERCEACVADDLPCRIVEEGKKVKCLTCGTLACSFGTVTPGPSSSARRRQVSFARGTSPSPVTPGARRSGRLAAARSTSTTLAAGLANIDLAGTVKASGKKGKGKGREKRRARSSSSPISSPLSHKRLRSGHPTSTSRLSPLPPPAPEPMDDAGTGWLGDGGLDPVPQAGPSRTSHWSPPPPMMQLPPPTPPPPAPMTSTSAPDRRWQELFQLSHFARRETQAPMRTYFISRARDIAGDLGVNFDELTLGEFLEGTS